MLTNHFVDTCLSDWISEDLGSIEVSYNYTEGIRISSDDIRDIMSNVMPLVMLNKGTEIV